MTKVGYTRRAWTDPDRASWTGTRPRPLTTDIWYPASDGAEEEEILVGPSHRPLYVSGRAAPDADLAPGPSTFPCVLLSHGTGGAALQLGWLATALAAHGYVVAGANHHGNTIGEPYAPQGFCLWWERAMDMTVILDRLLADELLGGRVDASRAGAAGFSLGGHTALMLAGGRVDAGAFEAFCADPERQVAGEEPPQLSDMLARFARIRRTDPRVQASIDRAGASYRDPRVDAAFTLAPVLPFGFTTASLAEILLPVSIVVGEADSVAPPLTHAKRFARRIPRAELTVLPGHVGHYTFVSVCTAHGHELVPAYCHDHETVDRRAVHAEVAGSACRFFDRYLAG